MQLHQSARATPGRRRLAVAVLASCCAVIGACSSGEDDADDDSSTTTTEATSPVVEEIAGDIRADLGEEMISAEEATCVARILVDELGEDGAQELNESSEDLASVPGEQQDAVTAGFNECVPGSAVAETVTTRFYEGFGATAPPTEEVIDCVGTELDGQTGDVVFEGLAATEDGTVPQVTIAAFEACVPDDVIAEVFVTAFEGQGATPEQARCTADAVAGRLSLEQLAEIGSSGGTLPADVQAIVTEAAQGCTAGG